MYFYVHPPPSFIELFDKALEDTQLWALELWDVKEDGNNSKYWRTARGVFANVSAHARTLNSPPTAIVIIVDVIVDVILRGNFF